jgi:hypothetical protein
MMERQQWGHPAYLEKCVDLGENFDDGLGLTAAVLQVRADWDRSLDVFLVSQIEYLQRK